MDAVTTPNTCNCDINKDKFIVGPLYTREEMEEVLSAFPPERCGDRWERVVAKHSEFGVWVNVHELWGGLVYGPWDHAEGWGEPKVTLEEFRAATGLGGTLGDILVEVLSGERIHVC